MREFALEDEGMVEGQTGTARQERIIGWYEEIQSSLHGPDFKAKGVMNDASIPRVGAAPTAAAPVVSMVLQDTA